MHRKTLLKFIALPFGIALLIAGLFFEAGSARGADVLLQTTPTPDRLAEPTLPASPSQADHGAQLYWLSCMPCHGDVGQGLTDEFRKTYPPEEEYCWESGCHGAEPYDSGFTLPTAIPALIGDTTLSKFTDAAQLNAYTRAAMPFWKPGSLTEEEAWQVTAFLMRENHLWDAKVDMNTANAGAVKIPRGTPTPSPTPGQAQGPGGSGLILVIALAVLFMLLFLVNKTKNRATIGEEAQ